LLSDEQKVVLLIREKPTADKNGIAEIEVSLKQWIKKLPESFVDLNKVHKISQYDQSGK
jgi:hypothetical protein